MMKLKKTETPQDWGELECFAQSFGHSVLSGERDESVPLFSFVRDEKIRGFAQLHKNTPIAFSGWHSDRKICTVRDVVYGMTYIKGWMKVERGGGLVAVPVGSSTFTPEIMAKLDFKRLHMEIYQTTE